jgi:hypothetical protein
MRPTIGELRVQRGSHASIGRHAMSCGVALVVMRCYLHGLLRGHWRSIILALLSRLV